MKQAIFAFFGILLIVSCLGEEDTVTEDRKSGRVEIMGLPGNMVDDNQNLKKKKKVLKSSFSFQLGHGSQQEK